MKSKPNVFKSFLLSFLYSIIFFITYGISFFLISAIILLLIRIPKIGFIFSFLIDYSLCSLAGLPIICCVIASSASLYIPSRLREDHATVCLSIILFSVYIIALHTYSLIVNAMAHDPVWTNIVFLINGFILLKSAKEYR